MKLKSWHWKFIPAFKNNVVVIVPTVLIGRAVEPIITVRFVCFYWLMWMFNIEYHSISKGRERKQHR